MRLKLKPRSLQKHCLRKPPLVKNKCLKLHGHIGRHNQDARTRTNLHKMHCIHAHKCMRACSCPHRTRVHACTANAMRICTYAQSVHCRSPFSECPTCAKDKKVDNLFPVMPRACLVTNCINNKWSIDVDAWSLPNKHNNN